MDMQEAIGRVRIDDLIQVVLAEGAMLNTTDPNHGLIHVGTGGIPVTRVAGYVRRINVAEIELNMVSRLEYHRLTILRDAAKELYVVRDSSVYRIH